jgi:hypothetical protein
MLKFLVDEPALTIDGALVVADLHIGYEHALKGMRIPDQSGRMLRDIRRLLSETKCKKLFIIGDVKHTFVGREWPEEEAIRKFMGDVQRLADVTVAPGNHDGFLRQYAPVSPSAGFGYKGFWLAHGHAGLPEEAEGKTVIMSHVHPTVEFEDEFGGRIVEKVWLRCPARGYKEVIIVPSFNHLIGGVDVRSGLMGPAKKYIDLPESKIYLLDGFYLGKVKDLKKRKKR